MQQQILIFISSSKIFVLVAILDLPQAISSKRDWLRTKALANHGRDFTAAKRLRMR